MKRSSEYLRKIKTKEKKLDKADLKPWTQGSLLLVTQGTRLKSQALLTLEVCHGKFANETNKPFKSQR